MTSSRCGLSSCNGEVTSAVAGIAKCIAGDLGSRSRQANLVLIIEAQQGRQFARALPRLHHIAFGAQGDMEI